MDMKCPICGEPWDNDSLHDAVEEGDFPNYQAAYRAFISGGCRKVFRNVACEPDSMTEARSAMAELMGDDSDGYISTMDDLEFLGMME